MTIEWKYIGDKSLEVASGFAGWECRERDSLDKILYTIGIGLKVGTSFCLLNDGLISKCFGVYAAVDASMQTYQALNRTARPWRGTPAIVAKKGPADFFRDLKKGIDRIIY